MRNFVQNFDYGQIFRADSPILVVTPHTGVFVPADLLAYPAWRDVPERAADPAGMAVQTAAPSCGVSSISACYHPCVIDLNVAAVERPLPHRVDRKGLCRTHTARGQALYAPGCEPSDEEVAARVQAHWLPFHAAVSSELTRLRKLHDNVLLLVFHASFWLSPYRDQLATSDCNIGTARGRACDRRLVSALTEQVKADGHSWVVNGRVADVFAAEHYGLPEGGIHAMEVEIAGRWRADFERQVQLGPSGEEFAASVAALFAALERALRALPASQDAARLAMPARDSAN
ncbi:N-formylglutamate amidohydrolase [Trinickia acidisoli]|uniref:N-formylglutamate amidohydrolase n=1 Tax=Trinickia acidisoli TaxID=2767482 RepID=UPI001F5D37EF|nr:N-formylglutamate amidohydrolase [Trinickia acidisoli]